MSVFLASDRLRAWHQISDLLYVFIPCLNKYQQYRLRLGAYLMPPLRNAIIGQYSTRDPPVPLTRFTDLQSTPLNRISKNRIIRQSAN